MIRGYARVSTKGQAKDGNSLEAQEEALRRNGAEVIYSDSFSGTQMDRPQLTKLLGELQEGDTLLVTKLDRFARTIGQASEMITDLINRGITVNVLNLGILSNDSMSTLMRNVLLAFAQFERDLIVERTQEGKAIAKAKAKESGEAFKEGRPKKYAKERLDCAMELLEKQSYAKVAKATGISVSTLQRERRARLEAQEQATYNI